MNWLCRVIIGLLLFQAGAFACFPCTPLGTHNPAVQIFSREKQHGESTAEVRLFLTKEVEPNYKSPVKLSCLSEYGIGEQIWSGKTKRNGEIDLRSIAPGVYWVAIKSKSEEGVYILAILKERDLNSEPWKLEISEGGLVNNKCGVEPIEFFFH